MVLEEGSNLENCLRKKRV